MTEWPAIANMLTVARFSREFCYVHDGAIRLIFMFMLFNHTGPPRIPGSPRIPVAVVVHALALDSLRPRPPNDVAVAAGDESCVRSFEFVTANDMLRFLNTPIFFSLSLDVASRCFLGRSAAASWTGTRSLAWIIWIVVRQHTHHLHLLIVELRTVCTASHLLARPWFATAEHRHYLRLGGRAAPGLLALAPWHQQRVTARLVATVALAAPPVVTVTRRQSSSPAPAVTPALL